MLPDYVILSNAVNDRLHEIEQQTCFANDRLKRLKAEGIPTDLPTLKTILQSEESFKNWLNNAEQSYIGKIGFLPKEEKKRIHSTFMDLFHRVDSDRCGLQGFIFNNQGYTIRQEKDGSLSVDMEEVKKSLEDKHRKTFTEKDKEYYSVILKVHEAFKDLQAFEKAEGYVEFSQTETFSQCIRNGITPEAFARSWEWGKKSKAYLKMMEGEDND